MSLEKGYEKRIPLIVDSLERYMRHGILPGGFLTAVLQNDLREAVGRADMQNIYLLQEIVGYLYNECPSVCWGSPKKVSDWVDMDVEARSQLVLIRDQLRRKEMNNGT